MASIYADNKYTRIEITGRESEITLFADVLRDDKPTSHITSQDESGALYSNVMLGRFHLNRATLGTRHQVLRWWGIARPRVYVKS